MRVLRRNLTLSGKGSENGSTPRRFGILGSDGNVDGIFPETFDGVSLEVSS
jgi:hypothetical protein